MKKYLDVICSVVLNVFRYEHAYVALCIKTQYLVASILVKSTTSLYSWLNNIAWLLRWRRSSSINPRLIIDNANLPAYPSLLAISRAVKCARRGVSNIERCVVMAENICTYIYNVANVVLLVFKKLSNVCRRQFIISRYYVTRLVIPLKDKLLFRRFIH